MTTRKRTYRQGWRLAPVIDISGDMYERIERVAKRFGMTRKDVVSWCINQALDVQGHMMEIRGG